MSEASKSERIRIAIEQSPEGIVLADLDGHIEYANPAWLMMYGADRETASRFNMFELCGAEGDGEISGNYQKLWSEGKCTREITHKREDGSTFSAMVNVYLVRDEVGNPVGANFFIRDISNIKGISEEMETIRKNFDTIVRKSVEGVIVVNDKGVIEFANPVVEQMFAVKGRELVGQNLDAIIVVTGGMSETDIVRQSGEPGIAELSETPAEWEGKPSRMILINDITERKRAQETIMDEMDKIETLNEFMIGREMRIIEVKKEVNQLLEEMGRPRKYHDY